MAKRFCLFESEGGSRPMIFKALAGVILIALLPLLLPQPCLPGLLGPSLPKGKEIHDPEMVQLFTPDFPYESIRMVQEADSDRYVIIRSKQKITEDDHTAYERKTLQQRGVFIRREWSPRSGNLMLAEMRLYRRISDIPLVIEYSEVQSHKVDNRLASPSEDIVRRDGKTLTVFLGEDFGRVFARLLVFPEKDAPCPDPPFVGKYPNSRKIGCREKDGLVTFTLVTGAASENVYAFYRDRLLKYYEDIAFDSPESSWKYDPRNRGVKVRTVELGFLQMALSFGENIRQKELQLVGETIVSRIDIFQLFPDSILGQVVLIQVLCSVTKE